MCPSPSTLFRQLFSRCRTLQPVYSSRPRMQPKPWPVVDTAGRISMQISWILRSYLFTIDRRAEA